MDVTKYGFDGEWIELVVDSERELDSFRFKVHAIGEAEIVAASKSPGGLTNLCIAAVVDWNLTAGPEALPCDEANKRRYLAAFATYRIKTINGKAVGRAETNLVGAISEFASKPDNFLKN